MHSQTCVYYQYESDTYKVKQANKKNTSPNFNVMSIYIQNWKYVALQTRTLAQIQKAHY